MKPANLVERLLEDLNDGANLTLPELEQVYLNDFTGDLGLANAFYVGPTESGHHYLALMDGGDMVEDTDEQWSVTDIFVKKKGDALSLEFSGHPNFSSGTREEAEDFFNKESHLKGGGKLKPAAEAPQPPSGPRGTGPFGDRYRNTGYKSTGNKWQDANYRATQDRGW
jgi:hypothetical protein